MTSKPIGASPPSPSRVLLDGGRLWAAWGVLACLALWAATALVLSGAMLVKHDREVRPVDDRLHLDTWYRDGVRVRALAGGLAEAAGMPTGRLVAVDGVPVDRGEVVPEVARRLRGPVGAPVQLTVAPTEGPPVVVTLTRSADPAPTWKAAGLTSRSFQGLRIAACLLRLLGGGFGALYLLTRRGRSLVALVGAAYFIGLIGSSLPFLVLHEMGPVWTGVTAVALPALENVFVLAFFTFCALFPDGRIRPRWAWVLLPLGLAMGFFTTASFSPRVWVAVMVPAFAVLVVARVVRFRRYASPIERQQTKWVLLALVAVLVMIIVYLALAIYQESLAEQPLTAGRLWLSLGVLVVAFGAELFFPAGIIVSLARYRLWDAETAWSRTAAYGVLTFLLAATIAGLTALGQAALGSDHGPLALGLATAAAALLFDPLQDRLRAWADARFLGDLQAMRREVPALVDHLRETESLQGVAASVVCRVRPTVHAEHVALVTIGDGDERVVVMEGIAPARVTAWLETVDPEILTTEPPATARRVRRQPWRALVRRNPRDRTFPVGVVLRSERGMGETMIEGWLLLGPRPDGSGYGPDDLEAVTAVADAVGRALRVVRVRTERQRHLEDRLETLQRGIEELLAAKRS